MLSLKKDMLRIQEDCSAWPEKLSMWLINLILVYTKKTHLFFPSLFFFGEADAEKKIKKIKLKSYINMQS